VVSERVSQIFFYMGF